MSPRDSLLSHSFVRRVLIIIGLVIIAGILFHVIRGSVTILLLIFAGIILGIFLNWCKCMMVRRIHLPAGISLAIVLVVLIVTIITLLTVLTPIVVDQGAALLEKAPETIDDLRKFVLRYDWGYTVFKKTAKPEDLILGVRREDFLNRLQGLVGFFSGTVGVLMSGVFIIFIGIYVAVDMNIYFSGAVRMLPMPYREKGAEVLHRMAEIIRWWLLGQFISMAVLGFSVFLGLSVLGIPFALIFALLTALMTFIPNLGPLIAFIPIAIVALSEGGTKLIYVAVFYTLIQSFEGFVLTPLVHRKVITLPPVLVISVQILLMKLIGFMGVILAIPLVACGMVAVKIIYIEEILGDRSEPLKFSNTCH